MAQGRAGTTPGCGSLARQRLAIEQKGDEMIGRILVRMLVLMGLVGCSGVLQAQTIQPFPQSQLDDEQRRTLTDHRVVISGLTRTQATTVPTRELRLSGELWRRVWAVEQRFTLPEVADHFFRQLDDLEILYQCKALDCGSSHFWANEIFRNARLVGREQFQHYRVALQQEAGSDKKTLYVLYVMQRGTRQVMVNLDVFTTTDPVQSGVDMAARIRQTLSRSHGWLPGFVTHNQQLNTEASEALVNTLKSLSVSEKSRLYLLVHCYDSSDMDRNLACSERLADQLRVQTFDGQRELHIEGQGALTAAAGSDVQPALRFVFWPAR
ncbi:DUF4892 domain-containing protein [Oceanospirillaceae bacterium ASx5O]|nr:DUF4892 domain-containing protein [Oceanospirillaceae bacterium ASx5O]